MNDENAHAQCAEGEPRYQCLVAANGASRHADDVSYFTLFALLARNLFLYALITIWSLLFLALFESLCVWSKWAF